MQNSKNYLTMTNGQNGIKEELYHIENKSDTIRQQVAEEFANHPIFQIPWRHHVEIITKCKSIKEAIESALDQDYEHYEIVIVDD